ncbi:rhomboid family intramembrane serine protease [Halovenus sp. WSH3]|uniref:Rhomboid family intramembrane serine protease n=1 Tax=Halovenus carboxidivorans TaxID=2692199 RepID=A0A6B0T1I7_9EURY|nr:rhomboid family intramembrane serine protease [Halovenus carboxidivorans]MXR52078.1 rhomboid family intramembrane serine protease [Halovenus carboxidivorans]
MARGSGMAVLELLFVFFLVYLLQIVTAFAGIVAELFVLSAPVSENPWTVVTSIYAHNGPGHLLSNAVALVVFGWPVARATTKVRFHLFVVASGSIAGVTQVLVSSAGGVLGASGAVFALLGYLLAGNRLSSSLARIVRLPTWASLLVFVAIAAVVTLATASPGVALIAHFAGLLVGLLAGRLGLLDTGSSHQGTDPAHA